LAVEKSLAIARQVAQGLACAHAASIIHRDIKPDNVLVGSDGLAKVLDLGLARLSDDVPREFVTLTGAGSIVGTPEFMSPEQAADPRHVDYRADVYGLGCTLYYLLTGKPPYEADSVFEKLMAHRDRPVPSVRAARGDVPRGVDALIAKMMAKSPLDRPQSMNDVVAMIDAVLAEIALAENAVVPAREQRAKREPSPQISAASGVVDAAAEDDDYYYEAPKPRRMREWAILATLLSCIAMLIARLILTAQ
jgi:serine/threonine protein kinase